MPIHLGVAVRFNTVPHHEGWTGLKLIVLEVEDEISGLKV
jgi:hypothetical protein